MPFHVTLNKINWYFILATEVVIECCFLNCNFAPRPSRLLLLIEALGDVFLLGITIVSSPLEDDNANNSRLTL